jgi:TatD DNase family protein
LGPVRSNACKPAAGELPARMSESPVAGRVRRGRQIPSNRIIFRLPEDGNERARALEKQRAVFRDHIRLAQEVKKPLIIHCRPSKNSLDAYENLLEIVKGGQNGVVHCFLGNWEIAEQLLDFGFYISFTGIITFKNADARLLEVVKQIPLDRILIETDAPYLTPEPFRGKTRCEPLHVELVARQIAEIRSQNVDEVIATTQQNGERLFSN